MVGIVALATPPFTEGFLLARAGRCNVRSDDVPAWYSSRGPTWYDGFQKPDVVAPGSHLVSNISTVSSIYALYPGGVVTAATTGRAFFRMSGTSMSAPVVTGVVALMLEASKAHGQVLSPNAIKAMLQYTATQLANVDLLTQGAGEVNGFGAVTLAAAVDPTRVVGQNWLVSGVNPFATIAGETQASGQRVVWGDRVVWRDLKSLSIAPLSISWGNLERANGDLTK